MPARPSTASSNKDETVRVVVRCRPISDREQDANCERVIDIDVKRRQVSVRRPRNDLRESERNEPHNFFFDAVYDWNSKQTDVYEETVRTLVDSVLNGFNGTIFAYGQTGTGKTFTMEGVRSVKELRGIIPNSFEHIFDSIAHSTSRQYLVRASYLEIYNENIRDLLAKDQSQRLELKERPDTGIYVKDLCSFVTKNIQEIEHAMSTGNKNRSTGATNMNEHSSRSHAIFMITIECCETGADGKPHIRVGKLNLVDLAGSERQAKTGSTGDRFKEATKINLSLSVLGNVISSLVDGNPHIPYRDSKLTRLLQDSLGGNSKTIMIATIGPVDYNYEESLTTLRYANRAKNIKNQPRINEDPKDALLRQFQEEIARLKAQLEGNGGGTRKGGRRRRKRADGTAIDDDENDDVDDEEIFIREQKEKLEVEKQRIINDKNMIESKRSKMLEQLQEHQQEIEYEQEERKRMQAKIQEMESKLLTGGKDIIEHTSEQERMLEQKRRMIADAERRDREIQEQLQQREAEHSSLNEHFTSIQQEVEIKRANKEKLSKKLHKIELEKQDLLESHNAAREELEAEQREIQKTAKLYQLIIENFIPIEERERIIKRMQYEPKERCWGLKELSKKTDQMAARPQSATGDRRPISAYSQSISELSRFKGENIILLQLDFPSRTTRDYEGPMVSPAIQAAIEKAMENEENIDIDANTLPEKKKKKKKLVPQQHQQQTSLSNYDYYPSEMNRNGRPTTASRDLHSGLNSARRN